MPFVRLKDLVLPKAAIARLHCVTTYTEKASKEWLAGIPCSKTLQLLLIAQRRLRQQEESRKRGVFSHGKHELDQAGPLQAHVGTTR